MTDDTGPDPDSIGWNYRIYRSQEARTFIADIGGFKHDSLDMNLAFFRYFNERGFTVKDSSGTLVRISEDAVRAMSKIMERHQYGGGNEDAQQ